MSNTTANYTDDSIQNVPWYDYIRIRPGVYVGDIGTPDEAYTGIYFLFKEVIDNGVDEHLMGAGNRIEVTLDEATNTLSVRDYGRGIPLKSVKKASCSLHTGAKFDGTAFEKTAGTHGIGIKAVNALSKYFKIESYRDGEFTSVEAKAGRVRKEDTGKTTEKNGVLLTFTPDEEIYNYYDYEENCKKPCLFKLDILREMVVYYCYLNPKLTVVLNGEEISRPKGLASLMEECKEIKASQPLYEPVSITDADCEILFTHVPDNIQPAIYAFTNGQYNPMGGHHVQAIKTALNKFATDYYTGKGVEGKDFYAGLVCIINIRVAQPLFESQTKIKLSSTYLSPEGQTIVSFLQNLTKSSLTTEFAKRPDMANAIQNRMKQAAKFRKDLQTISTKAKGIQKTAKVYNRKLSDCNIHYNSKHKLKDESCIFITEGDSAGGNLIQVRDIATQAVFYLRGKPKNTLDMTFKGMLENEELNLLTNALGISRDDISNLRYNKVIIATDADDDGLHIRLLVLTFFMQYFPELVKEGHVYIFQTPLYRVRDKKKTIYAYDDKDLARAIKHTADNREITRFKGLGEISPQEFKGFIGEDIRLDHVKMPDGVDYKELLHFYMGENSKAREEFVVKHFTQDAKFSGDTRVETIFQENYAKYSSYFNLDRALPEYADGLKPVQRRLMHVLKLEENGSYNKAASAVGTCMKYHPHGDASIADALVNIAQKGYLIDTQGNWGHPIKGLSAAAVRYIECRLSKLAKEILYSEPATEYTDTYDGKRKEPVTIPAKLPLVLLQGSMGIGASMACNVLPHNFNEVIDASIAYLRGEQFQLYPDFQFGGLCDVSEYNDGQRGGRVTLRAKIEKTAKNILTITEIPHGTITDTVCQSIKNAIDKGQLNIAAIRDNTTDKCCIVLTLPNDADVDREIAALYNYTLCQVRISTNPKVTQGNSVLAPTVTEMLQKSVEVTKDIISKEINASITKLKEAILFMTLERIYIENRYYRDTEELSDYNEIITTIKTKLAPHLINNVDVFRELTDSDYERLTEIKLIRITKYDANKCNDKILTLRGDCAKFESQLKYINRTVINWYNRIKNTYGAEYPRRTEITKFDTQKLAAQRREASKKAWFYDPATGLVSDTNGEGRISIGECGSSDRVYTLSADGTLTVKLLENPTFIGTDHILYGCVENDNDKVIQIIHQLQDNGIIYYKKFNIGAIRTGTVAKINGENSKILYCDFADKGEVFTLHFRKDKGMRKDKLTIDFRKIAVKGRGAQGNQGDTCKTFRKVIRISPEIATQ